MLYLFNRLCTNNSESGIGKDFIKFYNFRGTQYQKFNFFFCNMKLLNVMFDVKS